jgi:hypothetical protein
VSNRPFSRPQRSNDAAPVGSLAAAAALSSAVSDITVHPGPGMSPVANGADCKIDCASAAV